MERIEPYRTLLEPLWRQAQAGQFVVVGSDLVVLETLVKPLRDADTAVERLFRELFDADEAILIPTTRQLWEEAARLRATTSLKTPNALHAAAAQHAQCTLFITNDGAFRRVPSLPVVVLNDLLKEESPL